jgi:hypothetical protein
MKPFIIIIVLGLFGPCLNAQNEVDLFFQDHSFKDKLNHRTIMPKWILTGGYSQWNNPEPGMRPEAEAVLGLLDEELFLTLLESYQAEVFFGTLSGETARLQNLEINRNPGFQFGAGRRFESGHALMLNYGQMTFSTREQMTVTFFPFESAMPFTEQSLAEATFTQRVFSVSYQYSIPLGRFLEPYAGAGASYVNTKAGSAEWSLGEIRRELSVSPDAVETLGGMLSLGLRVTPGDFPVGIFAEIGYCLPDLSIEEGGSCYQLGLFGKF